MAFKLDCSLSNLYRCACHLIYWQQAKRIHVINQRNYYVVNPAADMTKLRGNLTHEIIQLASQLDGRIFAHAIPNKE